MSFGREVSASVCSANVRPGASSSVLKTRVYGYELQIGLPAGNELAVGTMFTLDPRVKEEYIWPAGTKKRVLMLKRDEPSAWLRDANGSMISYPFKISKSDSVLSQIIDPHLYPEISSVRNSILGWRFYHYFRTDSESPLRQPQIGVQTHVLSHDGSDLAAALRTILEIGNENALKRQFITRWAERLLWTSWRPSSG